MKETEIEKLVLGIDENENEAWKTLQASWQGGVLSMPQDEVLRRRAYKETLREIFSHEGITEDSVIDPWLKGKIRRIMK